MINKFNIKKIKRYYYLLKIKMLKSILYFSKIEKKEEYRNIIIVAPHPDDEVLGAGGIIISNIKKGVDVAIVFLTDGENSNEDIKKEVVAKERIKISESVLLQIGIKKNNISRFHLEDGKLNDLRKDIYDNAVSNLSLLIKTKKPDAVFVTHPKETWPYDHITAYNMTVEAVKNSKINCKIYGYWVWVWYSLPIRCYNKVEWKNTFRVDVKDVISKKRELINLYLEPKTEYGKPWSGVLPEPLIKSFEYPYEVITLIK
jgi:LmbE family N-acetylglucosaminyl deacetylase